MFFEPKSFTNAKITNITYTLTSKKNTFKISHRLKKCKRARKVLKSKAAKDREKPICTDKIYKLACPICIKTVFKFTKAPKTKGKCICQRCQRSFTFDDTYIDLTITSGIPNVEYLNDHAPITLLYQNPFVAYIYERGWRQSQFQIFN